MWEFLRSAMEAYGLAVVVMLAVIGTFAVAIRELWKRNQELGVQLRETIKSESDKRQIMRDAFDKKMTESTRHLHELQEKRLTEEKATTREMMALAVSVRISAEKQADALSFLRDTIARRDGA